MNTIIFEVYKNTLRKTEGFNPVSTENKYSEIKLKFQDEDDWQRCDIVTATFFGDTEDDTYSVATEICNLMATVKIPAEVLKCRNKIQFGISGIYNNENNESVTVATNIVVININKGIAVNDFANADLYKSLLELVNKVFLSCERKLNLGVVTSAESLILNNISGTIYAGTIAYQADYKGNFIMFIVDTTRFLLMSDGSIWKFQNLSSTNPTKITYTVDEINRAIATAKTEAVDEADAMLKLKADKEDTYTKQEVDALLDEIDTSQFLFVNGIEECTDTSKLYVLPDGYIYEYKESTVEKEISKTIDGELDNTRVSNGSTASANGYVTTALIDLKAYQTPFVLHLDGVAYIPQSVENYTRYAYFNENQAFVASSKTSTALMKSVLGATEATAYADGKSSVVFDTVKTGLRYVRFSGVGTSETSKVYVTYQQTVTESNWINTGVKFGNGAEIEEKISVLNNEGSDPVTLALLTQPVLDFYNSADYSDDDYKVSNIVDKTYPYRADIPIPYTLKWEYNENAMRTMVAFDTQAIGNVNRFNMRIYDATGLNKYPLYNLLPDTTYYYKVIHVLSDGSIVEAKNGSFVTSNETVRFLYVEGTQNVRDIGGWTNLNGKKVKYGKIIRGASLNDSSDRELIVTGRGRLSLAELKVQAELNLGAVDIETSIASNCIYKKIGYSHYTTAITSETHRTNFKIALEWIVTQLNSSKTIYMHCQGGCDRTGTLVFLLLGLLGVNESDLSKEYELSSFSSIGWGRKRNSTSYDYSGMVEALKTYKGDTIADKFYDFATTGCGISADTIETFRTLMLES